MILVDHMFLLSLWESCWLRSLYVFSSNLLWIFFILFLGGGEGVGVDILNLVVMDYNVHASYDSAAS